MFEIDSDGNLITTPPRSSHSDEEDDRYPEEVDEELEEQVEMRRNMCRGVELIPDSRKIQTVSLWKRVNWWKTADATQLQIYRLMEDNRAFTTAKWKEWEKEFKLTETGKQQAEEHFKKHFPGMKELSKRDSIPCEICGDTGKGSPHYLSCRFCGQKAYLASWTLLSPRCNK